MMVGGGWVAVRVLFVWHATGSLPEAVRSVIPVAEGRPMAAVRSAPKTVDHVARAHRFVRLPMQAAAQRAALVIPPPTVVAPIEAVPIDPASVQMASLAMMRTADTVSGQRLRPEVAVPPPSSPLRQTRLSVSSWMIARGGTGLGASALAPQLGGTQGGVRVDYALSSGFAATGRLAAPAAGAGREISLGIAWRPSSIPLRIVAEQRLALDGGRGGPALGLSTGVSGVGLPAGFHLDGYGQAGAIARRGVETYIDVSMRAARPLAELGGIALDVGGGAWGGAQRGVARVDVGPSIGARVPFAGQPVRISLDWRQRVAGNARPGSGPALALGSDF